MNKSIVTLDVKVKHLLDAYDLVQEIGWSNDTVEIKSGLEVLKFYLTTVFPSGGKSPEYPTARKIALFTIWRIEQVLKNKIEFSHINSALVQDVRLITVLVETYKSKVGKSAPTHQNTK